MKYIFALWKRKVLTKKSAWEAMSRPVMVMIGQGKLWQRRLGWNLECCVALRSGGRKGILVLGHKEFQGEWLVDLRV
jgi:hypothetical protein